MCNEIKQNGSKYFKRIEKDKIIKISSKYERELRELSKYEEIESLKFTLDILNDKNTDHKIYKEGFEILELVQSKQIPLTISDNFLLSFKSNFFREYIIKYLGYALLTEYFIDKLSEYIGDKKCLEIMAGSGAISKKLQDRNIDIVATDNYSWSKKLNMLDTWTTVENMDCIKAIEKYGSDVDFIICSWIPLNNSIGYKALKQMNEINPLCKMIVIGEPPDGCTAEPLFFKHCESIYGSDVGYKNDIEGYKSWSGINDCVNVVKYKD